MVASSKDRSSLLVANRYTAAIGSASECDPTGIFGRPDHPGLKKELGPKLPLRAARIDSAGIRSAFRGSTAARWSDGLETI